MKRRDLLICGSAIAFVACAPNVVTRTRPRIAITMDDFNLGFDKVLFPSKRNERILEALDKHQHKAAGFVSGRFVNNEIGDKVVQSWSDAGHLLGNHTYSHMNSTDEDIDVIEADILKNNELMANYPGYEKIFRFPFLAEGGTAAKIRAYHDFLTANGFEYAPVTIDSIDWYTTSRLEKKLNENPDMETTAYRDYYIKMCLEIAESFRPLAESLGYPNLPHTLLTHHNILNGLYLDDLMSAFKSQGWDFVDAKEALAHPIYDIKPEIGTGGRSFLSVLAEQKGVADRGFPHAYRGFGEKTMDALGL